MVLLRCGVLAVLRAAASAMAPAVAAVAVAPAVVVASLGRLPAGSTTIGVGVSRSAALTPECRTVIGRSNRRHCVRRGGRRRWCTLLARSRRWSTIVVPLAAAKGACEVTTIRLGKELGDWGRRGILRGYGLDFVEHRIAIRVRLAGRVSEGIGGRAKRARATAATMGTSAFVHLWRGTMWSCAVRANSAALAPVHRGRGSATRARRVAYRTYRRAKHATA